MSVVGYWCPDCGHRTMRGEDEVHVAGCPNTPDDPRFDWPVHQPECHDAPIPGRQWYSGCEPADYDSERGYHGPGPRVDPATRVCEGCGETACPSCGRENCPDARCAPC